jgi:hypothetical protein
VQGQPLDTPGYCYIDDPKSPAVEHCPPTQKRVLQFIDSPSNRIPANDAVAFVACQGPRLPRRPGPLAPDVGKRQRHARRAENSPRRSRLVRPLDWPFKPGCQPSLRAERAIFEDSGSSAAGTRRASSGTVHVVSAAVDPEIYVTTGVSSAGSSEPSRALTTPGAKTYPSAAALEGSARIAVSKSSKVPLTSQATECQGRRLFKEFFQCC